MRRTRIYQIDAFTTQLFRGNPAGVVPDAASLNASEMQLIARELNNSETAFVLPPDGPDHDVRLRYFTPKTEVPSCGHATIAAHYVRALEEELPSCTVIQKIGAGILPVEVIRDELGYKIVMTQGKIEFGQPFEAADVEALLSALGLTANSLDDRCPLQIVSTGHPKVLIGIRSREMLNSMRPNLDRLAAISGRIECNGYFVFTLDSSSESELTHGRMFAPAIGIPEDPVTGNANGPLGAYLVRHGIVTPAAERLCFNAAQGEALGRPGVVEVIVEIENGTPVLVKVAGRAVVAVRGEIELD